jgi:phage-related protein
VIKNVVKVVWDIFENFLLPVLKALWEWIKPHIPKVQKIVEDAFSAIFDAVDKVLGVFEGVTDAIQKAIDWLGRWNDKPTKKKTIEVEERRYTSRGGSIAGGVPRNATGTNYFQGGMTLVGEMGPELVYLPRGSKINPANETRQKMQQGKEEKQPIIIQMLTPDKRVLAEMVVDDVTQMQDFKKNRTRQFEGGS